MPLGHCEEPGSRLPALSGCHIASYLSREPFHHSSDRVPSRPVPSRPDPFPSRPVPYHPVPSIPFPSPSSHRAEIERHAGLVRTRVARTPRRVVSRGTAAPPERRRKRRPRQADPDGAGVEAVAFPASQGRVPAGKQKWIGNIYSSNGMQRSATVWFLDSVKMTGSLHR